MPRAKTQKEIQKKHTLSSNYRRFRSAYDLGDEDYSLQALDGITEQHHSDSCDINKILAQFMETGILPSTTKEPQYGDLTESGLQFQTAMYQIARAKSLFEELPENIRTRFDNEPHKFLVFAENPNNLDDMIEMGLINAPASTEDEALHLADAPKEQVIREDTVAHLDTTVRTDSKLAGSPKKNNQ